MYKPLLSTICGAAIAAWAPQAPAPLPLGQITLPPGFTIDVYATGVTNAREMVLGAKGTLFVGSRSAKKVYAIVDRDHDQKADQVVTIATGLTDPNGVAFREGALYVAEVSRITRYDGIEARLENFESLWLPLLSGRIRG
jgi:glucose/arabinose dehydrogenase